MGSAPVTCCSLTLYHPTMTAFGYHDRITCKAVPFITRKIIITHYASWLRPKDKVIIASPSINWLNVLIYLLNVITYMLSMN